MIAGPKVPAFDPANPDAQILDAIEHVRAIAAHEYSFDGKDTDAVREADLLSAQEKQFAAEAIVHGSVAKTIPGVLARLALLVPALDNERFVDRTLCEHGFLALYRRVDEVQGHAQQVMHAMRDLIAIEWNAALAAYEQRQADIRFLGDAANALIEHPVVEELCEKLVERFADDDALKRLLEAVAPNFEACRRKSEIIIAEDFAAEGAPWLVRDVFYLLGGSAAPTAEVQP